MDVDRVGCMYGLTGGRSVVEAQLPTRRRLRRGKDDLLCTTPPLPPGTDFLNGAAAGAVPISN